MDLDAELKDLKRRVDDLEGAVSLLAGKMRGIEPQLRAFNEEAARRFDLAEHKMDRIVQRLDTMNTQVWSLRDDLPDLVRRALVTPMTKPSGNAN